MRRHMHSPVDSPQVEGHVSADWTASSSAAWGVAHQLLVA